MRRLSQCYLRTCFFLLRPFFRIRIEGREKIEALSGPVLFVSNHHSYVDAPLTLTIFPCRRPFFPVRFLAWRGLYKMPPVGLGLWLFGCIPVRRNQKQKRPIDVTLAPLVAAIGRGESVFIYPEGKRTKDAVIQRVHRGAPYVALKTGVPVVPIIHDGTCGGFSIFDVFFRRQRITYRFGEPFAIPQNPEPSDARITEAGEVIRQRIASLQTPKGILV